MSAPEKLSSDKPSARSRRAETALPQWLIGSLRPFVSFFSRLFWKLEHKGVENIPTDCGMIVAANHQSYGDPFWLSIPIKRPIRFLAWSEAFSWPVVGKGIELLGAWPLQIEGSDPAAIRRSLNWLRGGGVVVIFPEGGRGMADGTMIRMKGGAVRMALEAGVPILPVTIRGANRVWPTGQLFPRFGKVEIIYHPLIHVEQHPGEETRACARRETERLAAIIQGDIPGR
ncbi:MAG TPA: lysophospholipid acyltransferase family protein [Pyrinomonadaceae bacterium]|nr:lysophospholipid acyltransferase family protein [Pyrinomonadaceae bacterium]